MLYQIEALTGLFLLEQTEFPAHICGPCEVALREAIVFRERIIRTQQMLLNSDCVADALQEIDLVEEEKLNLEEEEEEKQADKSIAYDEITVYDYRQDENESGNLEHLKDEEEEQDEHMEEFIANDEDEMESDTLDHDELEMDEQSPQHVHDTETETTPEPPSDAADSLPNAERHAGKPASKLYAPVNFAINTGNTPRINWSKLSEDEIVELKRERRKRDCICELCGRHFTCPSNFKVHLLRHTGVKNFACKECPLKFYTPHLLRRHMLAHLCEKPYPCQYCGQTFADHSGRIQHERNRHTNYKPYKCTKCDKAFAVSNKLKTHMLSHSGVRSFHCEICKVSFMRRPHLAAHYRSKGHEQNAQNFVPDTNNVVIDIENVLS
ncbi:hypothetical protein ACLKA6_019463 [Drosophila palustris]